MWSAEPFSAPSIVAPVTARSLVLVAASSQNLTRTWGTSPSSRQIGTFSFFCKLSSLVAGRTMPYDPGSLGGGIQVNIAFDGFDSQRLNLRYYDGVTFYDTLAADTNNADTTTWHHFCVAVDSTQATDTNRVRIYIDGADDTYTSTFPPQNVNYDFSKSGVQSFIGSNFFGGGFMDAKLSHFYYIDGQKLAASDFTTGSGAGTTHPKVYSGSYGNNGFFLNFSNVVGTTVFDSGINGMNWTTNNSPSFSSDIPV